MLYVWWAFTTFVLDYMKLNCCLAVTGPGLDLVRQQSVNRPFLLFTLQHCECPCLHSAQRKYTSPVLECMGIADRFLMGCTPIVDLHIQHFTTDCMFHVTLSCCLSWFQSLLIFYSLCWKSSQVNTVTIGNTS